MIRYRLACGGSQTAPESRPLKASKAGSGAKLPRRKTSAAGTQADGRRSARKSAGCGHEFESWFQNSDAFEALAKRGQITCPACGSSHVEKALMAPSVKTTKGKRTAISGPSVEPPSPASPAPASGAPRALAALTPEQRAFVDTMTKVRAHILANSEDVGKKFVEEARKIHHEEAEARSIHGEASIEEAKELSEEGIDIFPVPILPGDRN